MARCRKPDVFAPTEQYHAQLEAWNNKEKSKQRTADVRRAIVTRGSNDLVKAVYEECRRINELEQSSDPYEVDHIRPLAQGGQHAYENLRLLRASKNCCGGYRSESTIQIILDLVKFNCSQGYIS